MGRIDWIPIAELPEAFKDGRELLFWYPAGRTVETGNDWIERGESVVKRFETRPGNGDEPRWYGYYEVDLLDGEPTHFAELHSPIEP
jgi:hypothetical protein